MIAETTKDNLCETCKFCFADCGSDETEIEFGDSVGDNNVIECEIYEPRD